MSRAQRRAAKRLAIKQAQYEKMVSLSKGGERAYTRPGRAKHW